MKKKVIVPALLTLSTMVLAACGGGNSSETSSSPNSSKEPSSSSEAPSSSSKSSSSSSSSTSSKTSSSSSSSSAHQHHWSSGYTYDNEYHWHTCDGCDEIKDKAPHVMESWEEGIPLGEDEYQVECTICGYTTTVSHHEPVLDLSTWVDVDGQGKAHPYLAPDEGHGEVVPYEFDMINFDGVDSIVKTDSSVGHSEVVKGVAADPSGLLYTVDSDGNAVINGWNEDGNYYPDLILVIPETLGGHPVTEIGEFAFKNVRSFAGVSLPEGLKIIRQDAFRGFELGGTFIIPDSVEVLEDGALNLEKERYHDSWLKIVYGKGLKEVGGANCPTYCDEVVWNATSDQIKFDGTTNFDSSFIKKISIGEGVISLPKGLLQTPDGLDEFNAPSSLVHLGEGSLEYLNDEIVENNKAYTLDEATGLIYLGNETNPHQFLVGYDEDMEIGDGQIHEDTQVVAASFIKKVADDSSRQLSDYKLGKNVRAVDFEDVSYLGELDDSEFLNEGKAYYWGNEANPHLVLIDIASDMGNLVLHQDTRYVAPRDDDRQSFLTGTVTLNDGLLEVGTCAFYGYDQAQLDIPDSVIRLEDKAFSSRSLKSLKTLKIGNGIKRIPVNCFYANDLALTEVSWGENLTYIDSYALEFDPAIKEITLPQKLEAIEDNSFLSLRVNVPASVKQVDLSCSELNYLGTLEQYLHINRNDLLSGSRLYIQGEQVKGTVIIPDSVGYLGKNVLTAVKDITALEIGEKVTWNQSFLNMPDLDELRYLGTYEQYVEKSRTRSGQVTAEGKTYDLYFGTSVDPFNTLVLDENSSSLISWKIFANVSSITKAKLTPKYDLHNVALDLFGLTPIAELIVEDGVKEIPNGCMFGVSTLTKVNFPASLTEIGAFAFYGCSLSEIKNLRIVTNKTVKIGERAFARTGIEKLYIKAAQIGPEAFSGCPYLKQIELGASVIEADYHAFADLPKGAVVILEKGTNTKGYHPEWFDNEGGEVLNVIDQGTMSTADFEAKAYIASKKIDNVDTEVAYISYFQRAKTLTDLTSFEFSIGSKKYPVAGFLPGAFLTGSTANNELSSIDIDDVVFFNGALEGLGNLTSLNLGQSKLTLAECFGYARHTDAFYPVTNSIILDGVDQSETRYLPLSLNTVIVSSPYIPEKAFYGLYRIPQLYYTAENNPSVGADAFTGTCFKYVAVKDSGADKMSTRGQIEGLYQSYTEALTSPKKVYYSAPFFYLINSSDEAEILRYEGNDDAVMIPMTIDGYNVTGVLSYAFIREEIARLTFPASVKRIYSSAISGCRITVLTLPNTALDIYGHRQYGDPIALCYAVVGIDTNTGYIQSKIGRLIVPASCEYTPTFKSFVSIGQIVDLSSSSWSKDAYDASYYRSFETNVETANEKGKVLNDYFFLVKAKITYFDQKEHWFLVMAPETMANGKYIIPDEVELFDDHGFLLDLGCEEVVLPDSLLDPLSVPSKGLYTTVENGVTYMGSKDLPYQILLSADESLSGEITLPDGVKYIYEFAFRNCDKITKINFPSSLRVIGSSAFEGTSLAEVSFNEGLRNIGICAFAGTKITSVDLPASIVNVGEFAFPDGTTIKKAA